jgi:hypothetical protein
VTAEGGEIRGALAERTHFYASDVSPTEAHFYRATTQAAGDRATLVWNRRSIGCIRPGCGTSPLTLTDLDLEQLDPTSGTVESASRSRIDNVEQVRSPRTGEVIYKVKASSTVDGLPAEPYALAATHQITPLISPRPTIELSIDKELVRPGDDVHVLASVTNPSPDLTAEWAHVTLDLPAGVALAPGSADATIDLGTLARAGTPGASAVVAWTVRASGDGLRRLSAQASATRYGEAFARTDSATLTADGTPPSVSLTAPTGHLTEPAIPLSWSGKDSYAGVRDFDVEVSTDRGPYAAWLIATSDTSATFRGKAGKTYRFRVRATDALGSSSAYAESDAITIDAPAQPPGGGTKQRRDPHLRLKSIARHRRVVYVSARLALDASGQVSIEIAARAASKWIRRRTVTHALHGRVAIAFVLQRRVGRLKDATVQIRYRGDSNYVGQTVTRRLARL